MVFGIPGTVLKSTICSCSMFHDPDICHFSHLSIDCPPSNKQTNNKDPFQINVLQKQPNNPQKNPSKNQTITSFTFKNTKKEHKVFNSTKPPNHTLTHKKQITKQTTPHRPVHARLTQCAGSFFATQATQISLEPPRVCFQVTPIFW